MVSDCLVYMGPELTEGIKFCEVPRMNYPFPSKYQIPSAPVYLSVPGYKYSIEAKPSDRLETLFSFIDNFEIGREPFQITSGFRSRSEQVDLFASQNFIRMHEMMEESKREMDADIQAMREMLRQPLLIPQPKEFFINGMTKIEIPREETVTITFTVRPKGLRGFIFRIKNALGLL